MDEHVKPIRRCPRRPWGAVVEATHLAPRSKARRLAAVELGGAESAIVELSGARFAARKSLHVAGRSLCARPRWGKGAHARARH
jgi:hypothetical protein